MAVVATSTPKRHGFSIESLIGPRADSPRRQGHSGLLPRAEDFSITRDFVCGSAGRDSSISSSSSSSSAAVVRPDGAGSNRDRLRDLIRDTTNTRESSSPRDSVKDSGVHCRDSYRDRSSSGSPRDAVKEGLRDREVVPHTRDSSGRERERGRPRSRQGTVSPSSSAADEDKAGGGRGSSPASSSPAADMGPLSPRLEKTLPSSSPETENRLTGGWSSDDIKHLLGTAGAFQHQAHHQHHHPHHHGVGVDGSSLYQPLRVCNRSLSAAMSSAAAALMPHQFAGLPVNPLLYNLHRELASAPHPSVHPLLAARYPGFVHPRYPMGPPPGLLFHPYRKPKRNRTAFSPSQLLQLEQAFEKNHYVVGQERKTLASKLQLTETQVKVWFQNRRTKHKRMKAEEEATGCGVTSADDAGKTGDNSEGHMDMKSDASDHELMEDDICTSDEELSVTEDS